MLLSQAGNIYTDCCTAATKISFALGLQYSDTPVSMGLA